MSERLPHCSDAPTSSYVSSSRLEIPFVKLTGSPWVCVPGGGLPRAASHSAFSPQGRLRLSVVPYCGDRVQPLFYAQDTDLTVPTCLFPSSKSIVPSAWLSAVSGRVLGPLCVEFCKYDGLTCKEGIDGRVH